MKVVNVVIYKLCESSKANCRYDNAKNSTSNKGDNDISNSTTTSRSTSKGGDENMRTKRTNRGGTGSTNTGGSSTSNPGANFSENSIISGSRKSPTQDILDIPRLKLMSALHQLFL